MLRVIGASMLVLALSAPAGAFTTGMGENTAEFLSLRPGAREQGMADAFSPVAEGPEAMYFNPAGLASLEAAELSYSRLQYLRDFTHDYYAAAAPVERLGGSLGVAATIFEQDTIPVVDKTGTTLGVFRPHSESFALGYARDLAEGGDISSAPGEPSTWNLPGTVSPRTELDDPWKSRLSVGAAGKLVYERLYTVRAVAYAVDLGALWRPERARGFSFSVAGRNLGSREKFVNDLARLPAEASFGVAYDARLEEQHRLLPSLEVTMPYYGQTSAALGFEYSRHSRERRVRLAYRVGYDTQAVYAQTPLAGLTAGLGFQVSALSVDFGFQPYDALGDSFRMSAGWRFGEFR